MQKTEERTATQTEPMTEPKRKLFNVEEFRTMFEAGVFGVTDRARVELLDGEVYEMTPMGSRHAACIDRINKLLGTRMKDDAIVRVQCPIRLDDNSEPELDVSLLKPRDDFYATSHPKPEDVLLVVEVSDTTLAFDTNVKLPAYARAGIAEVWIVDSNENTVHVHTNLTPDGYRKTLRAGKEETFTSGVIAGELRATDVLG